MAEVVRTVVTLTAADYDAVVQLWQQADLPVKLAGRDSREQFAAQMAGDLQVVLGIWDCERLVGVVVTTHDGRKGWINRLAVHPDYRRQGLAQRLIEAAEQVLHDQGLPIIAALIEDANIASRTLFAQAGYEDYLGLHYVSKRENHDV